MGQSKLEHVENVDEGKPVCFRLNSTQDSIIVQMLFDGLPQRNTSLNEHDDLLWGSRAKV